MVGPPELLWLEEDDGGPSGTVDCNDEGPPPGVPDDGPAWRW